MPSIYLSTIPLPALDSIPGFAKIPSARLPFSAGEILEASITEKIGPSRFVLILKNSTFLADSDLSLKVGEKLLLKVEQLKPRIVLRLATLEQDLSLRQEHLHNYRSNPQALTDMFITANSLLKQKSLDGLISERVKDGMHTILKIMDSLMYSTTPLKKPFSVKDYIANLGLLLEHGLRKVLEERQEESNRRPVHGLKGALMQFSEELQNQMGKGNALPPEELRVLRELAAFTEASIKTIETQQVVNISYQENEGKFMVQIPFVLPEGIKEGKIFIEIDRGTGQKRDGSRCRFTMFLHLDALGNLMVDVSMRQKRLTCLFKCDDDETRTFLTPLLADLIPPLRLAGYDCDYLDCVTEKSIGAEEEEFERGLCQGLDAINLFI